MASRWVCRRCGSGLLAPARMAKDDVRRFCRDCSWETGRLVERSAPALDRHREQARAKRSAARRVGRERENGRWLVTLTDARGVRRELNVAVELRRALSAMGFGRRALDDLSVTIRRGAKAYHTGHAAGGVKVVFTFGARASYEGALELIYHEAAHLAAPAGAAHGSEFHRVLADALQQRWPWLVYGSLRPHQRGGCWEMGQRVIRQLQEHTRSGGEL